jgi:glycosyltransferase involved in cell wall biosynthesis
LFHNDKESIAFLLRAKFLPALATMPRFSLITATKGRTAELARLIASLDEQALGDYELIVVDQNEDERILPLIERSVRREKIKRFRSSPGVSRARNLGLSVAQGEIIAFPDDDCWYPLETLKNVSDWFDWNPDYDILSVTSRDSNGERSGNRWHRSACDLAPLNVFRTTVCYCYFLRSTEQTRQIRYDNELGPGGNTPYGASEDTDFILTAMAAGLRGRFEAKWYIGHARRDVRNGSVTADRVYRYGLGMGRVQKKHGMTALWCGFVLYDLFRAALMASIGRRVPASLWYAHGRGLAKAYFV